MALNYCPNCGYKLDSQDQIDMPDDAAPDLPEENQDPPADETIQRAREFVDNLEQDSPLVGQSSGIRSMLAELEQAMKDGESLDKPYYRQTLFELARELDRVRPVAMASRMRMGR